MRFLLSGFYFFYFAVVGIYIIFLPKVLSWIGYSGVEIGIVFATAPLVRFFVPFAFIKGLKLTHGIFVSALALMLGASFLFYITLHNFYALVFSNILLGIAMSMILPYVEVVALHVISKERYGRVRLYGSVGFIIVALVLVKFLNTPQTAVHFLVFTVFFTALFGYLISKREKKQSSSLEDENGSMNIRSHWKLWVGLTLMQVSFGPFYNFFTIYETAHGISMDMTVYLWSFGVIIEIIMFIFQGKLLQKNLLTLLQFTMFMTAVRWGLLFLFPSSLFVSFFTQSLHALSFALFHSSAISYLFSLYKQKKLAQQLFLGITYGFGGFVGAMYSGYVYEYLPNYLFLSSALIALIAFLFLRREAKSPLQVISSR